VAANKKINKLIKNQEVKKTTKNITPSKRKYPFKQEKKSPLSNSSVQGFEEETEEEIEDNKFGGIILNLSGAFGKNVATPKKYNMKKETELTKKFVKLITTPVEENTIDTQISQFKSLTDEKQKELVTALENRVPNDSGVNLMLKILTLQVEPDVKSMILSKYNNLQGLDNASNEYFKLRAWLDKVVSIPFGTYKDIPVNLDDGSEKCAEFMKSSKLCLDEAIYGQDSSKLQIMQFISTKITNPTHSGLSLLLVGPPGIGKSSLIKNGIAKSLNWPFQFISLGGDSDATTYTGHQLVYESSHCGKIVNSLIASKSMSTVLMFDEIDKVSRTPKGEEVMNMLIHLTDPVQNGGFEDKYLSGVPLDLSKVMFVFSANDINKIDKILLDRMMVIELKGYDLKQKTVIAEQYLLPHAIKDVNLNERISISKDILTYIIEEFSGDEKGVRELKRCIEQVTQKINMLRIYNSPELPFHIKDFSLPFIVKKEHIRLFLKKKETSDAPPLGMYT
jgi:ATP-dependent Lon protease